MPICYGNSGGYGRFIKRVNQPIPGGSAPRKPPRSVKRAAASTSATPMVMCADENRVYGSIRDAAREMVRRHRCGIVKSAEESINAALEGNQPTACGYRWVQVEIKGI